MPEPPASSRVGHSASAYMHAPVITVSIVSHGHAAMVVQLLRQLVEYGGHVAKVVVTLNLAGEEACFEEAYPFEVVVKKNQQPLGFGANHNQAFIHCDTPYFCVMNPDISLESNPFEQLLGCFTDVSIAIAAPEIIAPDGKLEASARIFPTPLALVKKLLFSDEGSFPMNSGDSIVFPDWVGGMFLLLPAKKYEELAGFDEGYFLYYEDVDICARCWRSGYKVALCRGVSVIHHARRASHSNLHYLRWHVASILRFFMKHLGRFPGATT